jgi:hypothetical protein
VVIRVLDKLSYKYENVHELIGQLILAELLKKYSHPIEFITFDTDEVLYDKSAGFAGAEIAVKVDKHDEIY